MLPSATTTTTLPPDVKPLLEAGFCEQRRFVKGVMMVIVRIGDLVAGFVHAVLN
jgi:hypothetical protein